MIRSRVLILTIVLDLPTILTGIFLAKNPSSTALFDSGRSCGVDIQLLSSLVVLTQLPLGISTEPTRPLRISEEEACRLVITG